MRTTITAILFSLSIAGAALAGGCGDKGSSDGTSCEKVTEHFMKHAPDQWKDQLGSKSDMVKRCETKMSAEERKCAIKANDFQGIMACRKNNKG